jgi:hypothetical protein
MYLAVLSREVSEFRRQRQAANSVPFGDIAEAPDYYAPSREFNSVTTEAALRIAIPSRSA